MAQPQQYEREVDFTERDGDDTNHAAINSELDAAALSINQIRDNLALIQRDDGSLEAGIVTAESLSDSAYAAIRGDIGQVLTDTSASADRSVLAAAQSETARDAAAEIYDQFDDRYLGSKTDDPSTDNDGQPLVVGALYFNTTVPEMRVWIGTSWKQTVQSPDTLSERSFLATAGQTSYIFVGGYRVGYTFAWVNGALLSDADITATNGVNITFTTPLSLNDEVRILSFKSIGTVVIADIIGLQSALDGKLATTTGAVGTGNLANDAVTADKIAAGAVGTAELANDSVTADKIAAGAVGASEIATGAVGTDELANTAVTSDKLANGAAVSNIGFTPVQQGTGTGQLSNTVKIGWDGSWLRAQVDASNFDRHWPINSRNGAQAWVNFNGTGTVAIRASHNVSSITDNGVGDYTVNYTTWMQDDIYAVSLTYTSEIGGSQHAIGFIQGQGVNGVRVQHYNAASSASPADKSIVNIAVFR